MSGYSSRAEAERVVRLTIRSGAHLAEFADLPHDTSAYYMEPLYNEVIHSRGARYGYEIQFDAFTFWRAVRTALRVAGPASSEPAARKTPEEIADRILNMGGFATLDSVEIVLSPQDLRAALIQAAMEARA